MSEVEKIKNWYETLYKSVDKRMTWTTDERALSLLSDLLLTLDKLIRSADEYLQEMR